METYHSSIQNTVVIVKNTRGLFWYFFIWGSKSLKLLTGDILNVPTHLDFCKFYTGLSIFCPYTIVFGNCSWAIVLSKEVFLLNNENDLDNEFWTAGKRRIEHSQAIHLFPCTPTYLLPWKWRSILCKKKGVIVNFFLGTIFRTFSSSSKKI